jgi:hypothetical protein
MTTFQGNPGNGSQTQQGGVRGAGVMGERMDRINSDAQQLWDDARGAVTDLRDTMDLQGRVERNPYMMLAAAFGVGYVLGGGLFTRTTARMIRLGIRVAALPMVKDELLGMAEAAVRGFETGAGRMADMSDRSAGGPDDSQV